MPAYIICRVAVEDPSVLKAYQAVAPAIIEKYKGKFIVKGGASVTLEGPPKVHRGQTTVIHHCQ